MQKDRVEKKKPRTFTPTMRKFFDRMDNCKLVRPFTKKELFRKIATREPEYVLAYIKGVVEFSCFEAIRPLISPNPRRGK